MSRVRVRDSARGRVCGLGLWVVFGSVIKGWGWGLGIDARIKLLPEVCSKVKDCDVGFVYRLGLGIRAEISELDLGLA